MRRPGCADGPLRLSDKVPCHSLSHGGSQAHFSGSTPQCFLRSFLLCQRVCHWQCTNSRVRTYRQPRRTLECDPLTPGPTTHCGAFRLRDPHTHPPGPGPPPISPRPPTGVGLRLSVHRALRVPAGQPPSAAAHPGPTSASGASARPSRSPASAGINLKATRTMDPPATAAGMLWAPHAVSCAAAAPRDPQRRPPGA